MKDPLTSDTDKRLKIIEEDFQAFAYSVSHDFRAPFRHIRLLTNLLVSELEEKISDNERELTEQLNHSVLKCQSMMDALLLFSRLSTLAHPFKPVSIHNVITRLLEHKYAKDLHDNIEINVAKLDDCYGDDTQICQLFAHLIDNAILFRKPTGNTVIRITSSAKGNRVVYAIADNGIGVSEDNHERIFNIFYKLNADAAPNNCGSGLWLSKKIIERHDGEIWCEDNNQGGLTVKFSLPASEPEFKRVPVALETFEEV